MEAKETIYAFEIARRSVGRAAFHLGIDGMSEGALDVLADVLLNYLSRVGRNLSHLVECSGRTSAHVNILDALQACELVASPAVERLHIRDKSDEAEGLFGAAASSTVRANLSSNWQGLAGFLFGPKSLTSSDDDNEEKSSTQQSEARSAGGKVGPSATETKKKNAVGWDAPYLDQVPPFPLASEKCANPHPLPPYVGLSLHRSIEDETAKQEAETVEAELDEVPDKVCTGSWGGILKRKAASLEDVARGEDITMMDIDSASAAPPPRKKVKIAEGVSKNVDDTEDAENIDEEATQGKAKLQIPSFYPPLPVLKSAETDQGRTVVETLPVPRVEQDIDSSKSVRSSLVQLGNYWGSGWDSVDADKSLAVPLGRNANEVASSNLVIPLGRASGSRVSRILEGSMDASAMQ